jgi:hypothetical protein
LFGKGESLELTSAIGIYTFRVFFSAMGIVGWVLGAILLAAVSGLTESP